MAGKAPLLLASAFFVVGAGGLVLTSAERASWGPFEPQTPPEQRVVVVDASTPSVQPPSLVELLEPQGQVLEAAAPALLVAEPTATAVPPTPEPTPTPIPPLRVFGISADAGGVSAAAATATLPPLRMVNVASDDESTPTPEPETTAEPEEAPVNPETTADASTPEAEVAATPVE